MQRRPTLNVPTCLGVSQVMSMKVGDAYFFNIADRADWRVEQDIRNARAHASKQTMLQSDGRRHFCEEQIAQALLFCNVDCRDDYDKE
jgi:hypothetical protein